MVVVSNNGSVDDSLFHQIKNYNKPVNHVTQLSHLIEGVASEYPDYEAVVCEDESLTYQQINFKANQLAHYLLKIGIKRGELIPLLAEKSNHLIIAIIAILKVGAVYVPINPELPRNVVNTILQHTQARFVFTSFKFKELIVDNSLLVICFDEVFNEIINFSTENLNIKTHGSDPAYVIYTSGTTGHPKGVVVSQNNILQTYLSWEKIYQLNASDTHLQMANPAFDVFTGDWVRALCSGGRLILCSKQILQQPQKLYSLIVKYKINCAEFVPSVMRVLLEYIDKEQLNLRQFRLLICGSDQWTMGEYRAIQKVTTTRTRIINSYGLSEATIDSTYFELTHETKNFLSDESPVPIGKPFSHVDVYLLDQMKKPVKPNQEGEIYISGEGVAIGYLNAPELTEKSFVYISSIPGKRLYKTGDKAKLLDDGNICFLGREQSFIKIHGRRIELSGIEAVFQQYPKIKHALVIPILNKEQLILNAYIKLKDESLTYNELINNLQMNLPYYCIPQNFYIISDVTLTQNGKVSRDAKDQKIISKLEPVLNLPKNELEVQLCKIWEQILKHNKIGTNKTFHELGGSSLLFVEMLEEVNQKLQINLQGDMCTLVTISDLSNQIREIMENA